MYMFMPITGPYREKFSNRGTILKDALELQYHAGSKILVLHFLGIQNVECVLIDLFTFLLLLWLLATKSTKYRG